MTLSLIFHHIWIFLWWHNVSKYAIEVRAAKYICNRNGIPPYILHLCHIYFFILVGSIPEPCPFQGSYTFSYTNGSIECHQPPSQLRACADNTKFRFVYKKCNGIPETSNQGRFN